jgi:hypothetical protein
MSQDDQKQLTLVSGLSPIRQRLINAAVEIGVDDSEQIAFQHSVFCQTGLPYRNPGDDVHEWSREQGNASLLIEAGKAKNPDTGKWVQLGLPFGPKPRLILAYLNGEALRHGSPEIEVDGSLTAFVSRILGFGKRGRHPNGRELRLVKEQLGRLSAAMVRLAITTEERALQIDTKVVTAFDLWFPKDERQRVLWPSMIRLSLDYFQSLQSHAVPLDERAIAALSHSAMGLDLYAWLAQRLHRIDPRRPQFITWKALKEQFGWHYQSMRKFRQVFRQTLDIVHSQYRGARLDLDERGITLRHSAPPIKGRIALIPKT